MRMTVGQNFLNKNPSSNVVKRKKMFSYSVCVAFQFISVGC
jgi:hypothetical protein